MSDRSINGKQASTEVAASIEEFAAEAYSQPAEKTTEKTTLIAQNFPSDQTNAFDNQTEYARPGYCRQSGPILPQLPQPIDARKTYRHPYNPIVQKILRTAAALDKHPVWQSYPSDISRQDPSACFLNMVLQQAIGCRSMGNTIEQIAANLDDHKNLTNHFYRHTLGEEVPGDIIIAYPKGTYRPEASIYLGNGRVETYDQLTKRITNMSSKEYYPSKDPAQDIYRQVVLYRWAANGSY